ncbi:uncharacterized protein CBL_04631 [Carabus blaptoides fortunei]
MSVEIISSPQPYFIPGYTGFCPQFKYRSGHTYGSTTHKLLLDPTINHAEHLVLSDRGVDDYEVMQHSESVKNKAQDGIEYDSAIYGHPMIPGYAGCVPHINGEQGQRFTVSAQNGMSSFEEKQLANKIAMNQLERQIKIQAGEWEPKTLEDRMLAESEFKLPLMAVRPECAAILRNIVVDEPPMSYPPNTSSQFLLDNENSEKTIKQGFGGHIPFGNAEFGKTHEAMTNSALCNFTSNYRQRRSTEWSPVSVIQPDPPLQILPSAIYHRLTGQIPNYTGHIPGGMFRYGKTYGNDTRNCKRWLRGDYSN